MFNIEQTAKGTGHILIASMFSNEDKPWFEVYKAAMLELDPQKLPERIVAAIEKVRLRLEEIQGDSDHHAERQQIEDALNSLRVLEPESDAWWKNSTSHKTSKSSERDWRAIAEQAVRETDPEKLIGRVEELCGALDRRNQQNQLPARRRTENHPDRKSP